MKKSKELMIDCLKKQLKLLESEPDVEVFSNRLAELMKEKKINQTELSDMSFISRQSITVYLSGTRYPSALNAVKLCDFFGVDIHYLLGFWDSKEGNT